MSFIKVDTKFKRGNSSRSMIAVTKVYIMGIRLFTIENAKMEQGWPLTDEEEHAKEKTLRILH